jgi:hypothetical protein
MQEMWESQGEEMETERQSGQGEEMRKSAAKYAGFAEDDGNKEVSPMVPTRDEEPELPRESEVIEEKKEEPLSVPVYKQDEGWVKQQGRFDTRLTDRDLFSQSADESDGTSHDGEARSSKEGKPVILTPRSRRAKENGERRQREFDGRVREIKASEKAREGSAQVRSRTVPMKPKSGVRYRKEGCWVDDGTPKEEREGWQLPDHLRNEEPESERDKEARRERKEKYVKEFRERSEAKATAKSKAPPPVLGNAVMPARAPPADESDSDDDNPYHIPNFSARRIQMIGREGIWVGDSQTDGGKWGYEISPWVRDRQYVTRTTERRCLRERRASFQSYVDS